MKTREIFQQIRHQKGGGSLRLRLTLLVSGGRMTFVGEQTGMEYAPVAGAEVTVNEVLYHTDAAGKLVLDAELSRRAQVSLQVELYTEDGRPLLIRLAPDYLLDLP